MTAPDDLTTRVARMIDDYRVGADGMLKEEAARAVVALVLGEAAQSVRGWAQQDVNKHVAARAIRALGVQS